MHHSSSSSSSRKFVCRFSTTVSLVVFFVISTIIPSVSAFTVGNSQSRSTLLLSSTNLESSIRYRRRRVGLGGTTSSSSSDNDGAEGMGDDDSTMPETMAESEVAQDWDGIGEIMMSRDEDDIVSSSNRGAVEPADDDEDKPNQEGQDLASEFYRYQKRMKNMNKSPSSRGGGGGSIPSSELLSEKDARTLNRQAFSRRREIKEGVDVGKPKDLPGDRRRRQQERGQKFTGRSSSQGDGDDRYLTPQSSSSSSAGLFSGAGQSVYSRSSRSSPFAGGSSSSSSNPRQDMMANEFDLTQRAGQSIGVQAIIVLVLLLGYLAVGLTGGITDGSERDALDTSLEGMEQLIPQPSDTEPSLWL